MDGLIVLQSFLRMALVQTRRRKELERLNQEAKDGAARSIQRHSRGYVVRRRVQLKKERKQVRTVMSGLAVAQQLTETLSFPGGCQDPVSASHAARGPQIWYCPGQRYRGAVRVEALLCSCSRRDVEERGRERGGGYERWVVFVVGVVNRTTLPPTPAQTLTPHTPPIPARLDQNASAVQKIWRGLAARMAVGKKLKEKETLLQIQQEDVLEQSGEVKTHDTIFKASLSALIFREQVNDCIRLLRQNVHRLGGQASLRYIYALAFFVRGSEKIGDLEAAQVQIKTA